MRVPYRVVDNVPPREAGPPGLLGCGIYALEAFWAGWACDRAHANRAVKFMKGGDQKPWR